MTWGRNSGLGTTHMIVLQAVADGRAQTLDEVRQSLKLRMSGESVPGMLAQLMRRDYLTQINGGRYSLTAKGYAALPKVQAPIECSHYVPPSYMPSRPGAMDYARYPSVAAGVRRPYHAEGVL